MPTKNVNLSAQQALFIRQRIRAGQYLNASEVVRAGLRLLEYQAAQDKLKLDALRKIARTGFDELDRGNFETVDPENLDAFLDKIETRSQTATKHR